MRVKHSFGLGRVISIFSVEYPKIPGTRSVRVLEKSSGTRTPSSTLISSGTRMPSATRTSPGTGTSSDI